MQLNILQKDFRFDIKQKMSLILLEQGMYAESRDDGKFRAMSVKNVCMSMIDSRNMGITFTDEDGTIAIVCFEKDDGDSVLEKTEELSDVLKDEFECKPKITVGSTVQGFENLVFVGKNGKPITEHTFQVTLDWIEKSINKERKRQAEKNKTVFIPIPHFIHMHFVILLSTRCFEAGIDAKVVQGFLGHYSIAITLDLYTHVTDDKAKSEMDKLQNLYKEII